MARGILTPIDDHPQRALEWLTCRYEDKPLFRALLRGFARSTQDVEDAVFDAHATKHEDTADGHYLKRLARGDGLSPIDGETDEELRARITAEQIIRRSNGTWPVVLGALRALVDEQRTVNVRSMGRMSVYITIEGQDPLNNRQVDTIKSAMPRLLNAGGAYVVVEIHTFPAFAFDGPVDASRDGFDEGYFTNIIAASSTQ